MKKAILTIGCALMAVVPVTLNAAPATKAASQPEADRDAEVRRSIREMADYAQKALLQDNGQGRADYDYVASEWHEYEPQWHTGQLIWALVSAGEYLEDPSLIASARRAGDWWIASEYKAPHPFAGLVNAYHGDRLGHLINWTTIADGTPGLYILSKATGDRKYADTATRSGRWLWDHTRVPKTVPGGEGLFYNLFDPKRGVVLTDWNAHKQGIVYDPAEAARVHPPINELARPNIEGFLFADMCQYTGEKNWCKRFIEQADFAISKQYANGLWMDFEPNDLETGQVHPRFNIWNAEALVKAYDLTGDRKYLEAAAKTARFHRDASTSDGTIYYNTRTDGSFDQHSVTGSGVAFNGILMLQLRERGYTEFDKAIERAATWIIRSRFNARHPDPNLAGAVIDTRYKAKAGATRFLNRDVGTTFGIRFMVDYARDRAKAKK